jgi:phospholipase C
LAGSLYTRRDFLAASLAVGAGGLSWAAGVRPGLVQIAQEASKVRAAGSDLGAVKHVVMLMLENRSFDHLFGTMKGVRGFDDHSSTSLGAFSQAWPGGKASTLLPFHLDTASTDAECTYDLTHDWGPQHDCWNKGAMDSFVSTHVSSNLEGPGNGVLTMGYYTSADSPFFYALADAFTVCDHYHCSVLGPTHPNRLFWVSGTNDPDGVAGGPILTTSGHTASGKSTEFLVSWETMPERLSAAGVSWKAYNPYGSNYQPTGPLVMTISDNILLYFKQYSDTSSALYQNAFGYYGPNVSGGFTGGTGPNDFAADVKNDTLPSVSWIIPPVGYDSHPPAPIVLAEWYVSQVLKTLMSNSKLWASTVLFVTWDENDGFFDHVPPPTAPAGTAGEYLTVSPLPSAASGVAGPIGLGMRVPMLVVSPFSVGGYLCSDTFDHTSQLRFLETLFGVSVPNLSSWRRSVTGDLTAALPILSKPSMKKPTLPKTSSSTTKKPIKGECTADQLLELNDSTKTYKVPLPQTMPTQQKGSLKPTPS